MNNSDQLYIDHEVRVQFLEKIASGLDNKFNRIEDKMDSHFKWMLGTIFLLIVAVLTFIVTLYLK